MIETKAIELPNPAQIYGADILAEVMSITPAIAAEWLKCNTANRPVRKRHIEFLVQEINEGNWQVNGQAIVIGDNEQIIDGQHRLHAIIASGKTIRSLVVYGISPEAFRTIDTGAVRTGADALFLHMPEIENATTIKSVSTAVQWCNRLDQHTVHHVCKMSNTDVINYLKEHPSLIQCVETLQGYPKDARPLSLGCGGALYEMFSRKHQAMADEFMERLYTGEELIRTDAEYVVRAMFAKDDARSTHYPAALRMRMVIKAWNWKRRGNEHTTVSSITVQSNEDRKVRIF